MYHALCDFLCCGANLKCLREDALTMKLYYRLTVGTFFLQKKKISFLKLLCSSCLFLGDLVRFLLRFCNLKNLKSCKEQGIYEV